MLKHCGMKRPGVSIEMFKKVFSFVKLQSSIILVFVEKMSKN